MGGDLLEQVVQRICGCPTPGSVKGQNGWGFEEPGQLEVSYIEDSLNEASGASVPLH